MYNPAETHKDLSADQLVSGSQVPGLDLADPYSMKYLLQTSRDEKYRPNIGEKYIPSIGEKYRPVEMKSTNLSEGDV